MSRHVLPDSVFQLVPKKRKTSPLMTVKNSSEDNAMRGPKFQGDPWNKVKIPLFLY